MKHFLSIFAAVLFCLFAGAVETKAQLSCTAVAYGASWVFQEGNEVHGYSATELNGCAGAFYDPATWGRFSEGNWATETPILLGEAYTEGYGAFVDARIDYQYIYPANNEYYNVDTSHYVIEYFQQYGCPGGLCGYYWYDPFGFGYLPGTGGPTYPGTGNIGFWIQRRRRIGGTYHTIRYQGQTQCAVGAQFTPTGKPCVIVQPTPTPTPVPTITAKIKDKNGNDITGAERTVMIGVPTKLTAESNSSQPSYSWSVQGATTNSTSAASIKASWSAVGTYTVSLTAAQGQSTVTVQTTIKVKLPTLESITATQVTPKIYQIGTCTSEDGPNVDTAIILGCQKLTNGTREQGIMITAEAKAPTGDISNQEEAKLQFVQLSTPFRSEKRLPDNRLYCYTDRESPNDLNTGWKLDGSDPVDLPGRAMVNGVPSTATFSGGNAKARMNDFPEESLRSTSEEFIDDKFETYAVYSVKPVEGEVVRRVIGKLPWDWNAKATKAANGQWSLDSTVTNPASTRTITGTAITQETIKVSDVRSYTGIVKDTQYKYCGPQEQQLLDAKFVSMNIKSVVKVKEEFEASITMTNTGTKTWTTADFNLVKQGSSSSEVKPTLIDMPREVATNQTVTINFTVKPIHDPGSYKVSWRMADYSGVGIEFGEPTPFKTIQVVENSNPPPATSGEPSDLAVWRRNTGVWYLVNGSTGTMSSATWGVSSDIATPGDYDGDGKTDFSIFRQSTGEWYTINSSNGSWSTPTWGQAGDVPAPADYDGDGKTDVAVVRETDGVLTWYIVGSSNSVQFVREFGITGDKPSPADYDGDGKADISVWRSGNQIFYSLQSQTNSYQVLNFEYPGTEPVSADYDGDGKADYAVKDGNYWHILYSYYGYVMSNVWKLETDIPVQNDYDGDGKVDIAVWRESTGQWYIRNSSDLSTRIVSWGEPGDIPVPAYYRR